MKKRTEKAQTLANNLFALKWLYKISPFYVLYTLISYVVDGISIMFEHTFLVAYIVGCIEHQKSFGDVLAFFIPVTSLIVVRLIVHPIVECYLLPKHIENIDRQMRMSLYQKAAEMDIARYDDPAFYNDFIWAMQDAPAHMKGSLETLANFLKTLTLLLVLGIYMVTVDITGLFFIFITLFSVLFLRARKNRLDMAMEIEKKPAQRKRDYINRVFYLSKYAKDLRLSEMDQKLYEEFRCASAQMESTVKKHSGKIALADFAISFLQYVLTFDGLYLTYLMYQTLAVHAFDYGTMIALYNAANKLRSNMQNVLQAVPAFHQHSLYIEKMRKFLETENNVRDTGKNPLPPKGGICLKNLSFTYPNSSQATLKNITMEIPHGQKIALVGYNGAGKSSLVKLLMRLYDPTGGEILYNGKSIREYPLAGYRKMFSVIFQNYELIAATLSQNIAMSTEPLNENKALGIFRQTGFIHRFQAFKDGFSTPVTKEFDPGGVNLSSGEAQKISVAHVLYSGAGILILDEPSSALDPVAEYQLNRSITEISRDKTVIIISHRLSTTRMVDQIFMLENGTVAERGSHEELMRQNGKYAAMFALQAEKYR